jgi:hypothetical protein
MEFSALSRQSIIDFIKKFKHEYKNVHFGFNSYKDIPESWLTVCA